MLSTTLSATTSLLAMLSTNLYISEGRLVHTVLLGLCARMDCAQDRGASKMKLPQGVPIKLHSSI